MNNKEHIQGNKDQSAFIGLPYEPESIAELLFATHVFLVEVVSLDATPWTVGDDGLEHRRLTMVMRLLQLFKGMLALQPGLTFQLTVAQRRESEFFVTDYHGLWSHIEPYVSARYVAVARGAHADPATLMQESHLDSLLDSNSESDIQLALEAEQLYEETLQAGPAGAAIAAVRALLKLTLERRTMAKDVFGRYLWARVEPMFLNAPETLLQAILAIIQEEDTTVELRRSLITRLYEAVLMLEPTLDLFRSVIRAFFALLTQASSKPIHSTLVEIQLYNLVFIEGKSRFSVQSIFPDLAERAVLKAAMAQFDSDRARALLAWFDSIT